MQTSGVSETWLFDVCASKDSQQTPTLTTKLLKGKAIVVAILVGRDQTKTTEKKVESSSMFALPEHLGWL
jgi:hypothetical protein